MAKQKTAEVQQTAAPATEECCPEEQVRIAAYYKWESSTGGNPVDDETTRQFWLEAEQQVAQPQSQTEEDGGDR
jgi:hypothetical protein